MYICIHTCVFVWLFCICASVYPTTKTYRLKSVSTTTTNDKVMKTTNDKLDAMFPRFTNAGQLIDHMQLRQLPVLIIYKATIAIRRVGGLRRCAYMCT